MAQTANNRSSYFHKRREHEELLVIFMFLKLILTWFDSAKELCFRLPSFSAT